MSDDRYDKLFDILKKIREIYEDTGEFSTRIDEDYVNIPNDESLLIEELIEILDELE